MEIQPLYEIADDTPTPAEKAISISIRDEIIKGLTIKQRRIAKYLEKGFKRKEIVEFMGYKNRKAVDSLIRRMRERLQRKKLTKKTYEEIKK